MAEPVPHALPVVTYKRGLGKISVVFACGTALFSDGYQNGIVGSVNTILRRLYPKQFPGNYSTLFSAMGFAGTVLGMLSFGFLVDRTGRKGGMMLAAVIVAVAACLQTGAYGAKGSHKGMFNALIAYRFISGIGIGGEYPAGSVGASENTEDPSIKKGTQHMLFALATNCAIDAAFVVSAFVPLVLLWIAGENHLRVVWRLCFAIGIIPPVLVLFWRLRMAEPARYQVASMKHAPTPYWLTIKRYWKSFLGLSIAWFVYDFIAYPFGIYSSTIVDIITDGSDVRRTLSRYLQMAALLTAPARSSSQSLKTIFAWNIVINAFYMPGCIIGAVTVDKIKPKRQMIIGLVLQAVTGFAMSAAFGPLQKHGESCSSPAASERLLIVGVTLARTVAGFAVIYGIFLSFGEFGPGDCLGTCRDFQILHTQMPGSSWSRLVRGLAGLLASKSWPTAVRGRFYGIAAAIGKIGAFAGTYAFPKVGLGNVPTTAPALFAHYISTSQIIASFPAGDKQASGPFWVGSGLGSFDFGMTAQVYILLTLFTLCLIHTAIFSAICVLFLVPEIHADHMTNEDEAFRVYLEANGYDTSRMGLSEEERQAQVSSSSVASIDDTFTETKE
ncbi:BZ3500_MvSof-1268-A1-R1_Chr4-1g06733 [Microbotryum saponariae]|uniref:BZ3500_MvSof-1268-A1-R1_Chr4-1g06733 protein n=1 Tax=Microbotryum saponariae TaxID=289078 RepID=A0A2X0MR35_9BASI|nr:BZ3500_MvSof-1268-A1-R1_Chr4-1g06733 [Microbotryum saponariae]SDA06398.1 BZ3501_MvSof-1269-A2-R1_Chr4-1g06443 [Microbotryum saponariae]